MKRLFTISALFFLATASNILKAQNCEIAASGVKYNYSYTDPGSGQCIINLDLYLDIRTNPGSKYIVLHIWPTSLYPDLAYINPPDSTELAYATTMVIHHFQDHSLVHLDTVYKPDPRVLPEYLGINLDILPSQYGVDFNRFRLTNINLAVSGSCETPQSFTLDSWATESESMNQVHCIDKGKVFYANNPQVIGLLNCNLPHTYNVQIRSIDPVPMTVSYDVYLDDSDNVFNKVLDTLKVKAVNDIIIDNTNPYNSGTLSYLPYSAIYPYANRNLWVEVSSASIPNSVIYLIENSCAALPVKLKSFSVTKQDQTAILKWITIGESGNKGFYIEKKIGDQNWQTIGFVASQAEKGNSSAELVYSYFDPIFLKGIIQYRLKQIDINGEVAYSLIRVVKNEFIGMAKVYPNPSQGQVNIVFADAEKNYAVQIFDTQGKLIRDLKNCNSVQIVTGLGAGFYMVRVTAISNKEVATYKLIVQ